MSSVFVSGTSETKVSMPIWSAFWQSGLSKQTVSYTRLNRWFWQPKAEVETILHSNYFVLFGR